MLFAVALIIDYDPRYRGDTTTYINASYKLAHGEIDLYRTPLLPFLILCFRTVFGETGLTMLCVFQQLLFLLICLIGMIMTWVRRHRVPWLMAYLWGMVFASHITAMLGAMADWDRLTYGSFPCLLLMFAIALRYFISYVRTINRPYAEHCSAAVLFMTVI